MKSKQMRPPFCFDWSCRILVSTFDDDSFDKGHSFFCFGKLEKKQVFVDKETTHENDISHCYYTPLKGMIRFFMNTEDLWGEAQAKIRVLNKLVEVDCLKCDGKMQKVIRHECFNCKEGKG